MQLASNLPHQITLFGTTRLERSMTSQLSKTYHFLVRIPFSGIKHGEMRVWCDLDLKRLRAEERAHARGILAEATNVLAGMSLSDLADRLNGHIMLAPPIMESEPSRELGEGTSYQLYLLDGYCHCHVEIVTKERQ